MVFDKGHDGLLSGTRKCTPMVQEQQITGDERELFFKPGFHDVITDSCTDNQSLGLLQDRSLKQM
jgi:hypothetical protein